ncbi:hypothetical protein BDL97_07G093900 [Sphagnum fallax]|nr:hypothetical protein BDL97_07G093900 [Sphagnum fallax]
MGEEKRHEMMETLFGVESEDSDDAPEAVRPAASDHASDHSAREVASEEGDAGSERAKVEEESEGERGGSDVDRDGEDHVESESERKEVEESASSSEHWYQAATHKEYKDKDAEELGQGSEGEEEQQQDEPREGVEGSEAHDVFGESDKEGESEEVEEHHRHEEGSRDSSEERSEEEREEVGVQPRDIVGDDEAGDTGYDSEDDRRVEQKPEKPMGPPLHLEVPLQCPPGRPDQLNVVRLSNIMDIDVKPFDPNTYVAEEMFVTDDVTGRKQRLRLEGNVVRWRASHNDDGTTSSILQSQGQLLRKMKFMPSSLTSKSHRLLTALVDSRHKKVFKVKKVAISTVDPEKEKEAKERAAEQRIRSKEDLQRKQEKVLRRFAPRISDYEHEQEANQQLSPGYLEGALDEEDEVDYSERRDSRRFQEQLEAEERAERKILSAKKQLSSRVPSSKPKARQQLPKVSQYDDVSDESDREPSARASDPHDDQDEAEMEDVGWEAEETDNEDERSSAGHGKLVEREEKRHNDDRKSKRDREEDEPWLAKKPVARRRVVVSDSDED